MKTMSAPFSREIHFDYGVAQPLSPYVRRLVARNPGSYTFKGTNVYVVGRGEVAVIDPGPDDDAHVEELLAALQGETVTRILLTHTHRDHSGAVARLKAATGATTYALRPGAAPRGAYKLGEPGGVRRSFADTDFEPDVPLDDGDQIVGVGWLLAAIHTPGHAPDHVCYALPHEKALFTGDHVMPWSTSVIAPPEGNMRQYMASLHSLVARDDALYYPGHGGRVHVPKKLVRAYILHRQVREQAVLDALAGGHRGVDTIMPLLYKDIEPQMRGAASLSVLAHLEHLQVQGRAVRLEGDGLEAVFAPV
jgi:glyoxylase-like metal-dependent hydrolase (beta-lactamase superfamily II)